MDLVSENSAPLCHFRQYKVGARVPTSAPEFWEMNSDPRRAPGLIKHQWALLTSWWPQQSKRSHCPLSSSANVAVSPQTPPGPPGAASEGEQRAGDSLWCPIFQLNVPSITSFIVVSFQVLFLKENFRGWCSGCPVWLLHVFPKFSSFRLRSPWGMAELLWYILYLTNKKKYLKRSERGKQI